MELGLIVLVAVELIPGIFEDSIITQFQEILDVTSVIWGTDVRVQYGGGVMTDPKLVEENKGK